MTTLQWWTGLAVKPLPKAESKASSNLGKASLSQVSKQKGTWSGTGVLSSSAREGPTWWLHNCSQAGDAQVPTEYTDASPVNLEDPAECTLSLLPHLTHQDTETQKPQSLSHCLDLSSQSWTTHDVIHTLSHSSCSLISLVSKVFVSKSYWSLRVHCWG